MRSVGQVMSNLDVAKAWVEIVLPVLTLITVIASICAALYKFGLRRERFTFLNLKISAKPIRSVQDVVLVNLAVHLENTGDTKITARQARTNGYLNSEPLDICRHAGTLKIRFVPEPERPLLFDWYSLPSIEITNRGFPEDKLVVSESDLEQVNYLNEFQDPAMDYEEVDFWIEPHEKYGLAVFVWLQPGIYAAKAIFLGERTEHGEEEYWSDTILFSVAKPSELDHV